MRQAATASTGRCWTAALARPKRASAAGAGGAGAGARRAYLAGRQDLHADDGRRRHHGADRKAAVDQPGSAPPSWTWRSQRAILAKVPEVDRIVARVGSDELGLDPMGLNETDIFLVLKPQAQWRGPDKDWLVGRDPQGAGRLPRHDLSFTQPIEMRVSEMLTGARGDLAVKIFGPDLATLGTLARPDRSRAARRCPAREDVLTADATRACSTCRSRSTALAAGRAGLSVEPTCRTSCARRSKGVPVGIVIEARPAHAAAGARRATSVRDVAAAFPHAAHRRCADGGDHAAVRDRARSRRGDGPVKVDRENGSRYRGGAGQRRAAATWSASSRKRRRRVASAGARCRPATAWPGAASSRTSSAPPRGWRWWCRSRWRLIFLLLFATLRLAAAGAAGPRQHPVRAGRRRLRAVAVGRIPVGAGLGRLHRAARHRRAQRPGDGDLLQPAARRAAWRSPRWCVSGALRRLRPVLMTASITALRPGAAAVRHRAGLGDPAPAGDRGDRRPGDLHRC